MKHEKSVWVLLIQLMCLRECFSSNSTQSISTEESEVTTLNNVTLTPFPLLNSSDEVTVRVKNERKQLELLEIIHGKSNVTGNDTISHPITEHLMGVNADPNTRIVYLSNVLSWNDSFKTNYNLTLEAIASQQDSSFWLQSTGAIAAGVFLISAVVGYFGCVGYRRFMQKKYGNSQILTGEDVYDTRDLRYFEI